MVVKEVEDSLATNATLSATSSRAVQGMVQSWQNVKLLMANVLGGVNQEQKSGNGLGLVYTPSSLGPLMGKCSRSSKDSPWRIK